MSPSENGAPTPLPVLPTVHETPGGELPPALTNPPGVDNLLATVRRRWPLILFLGFGGALLAFFLVWQLVPGRYASILILGIQHAEGEGELATFSRLQQGFLKSSEVLGELLRRVNVAELREVQAHGTDTAWLRSALVVDQPLGAGFETIRVTLQGDNPDDIALLLNELADVYIKRQATDTKNTALSRANQFSAQITEVKDQIAAKQKEISDLEGALGLGNRLNVEAEIARLDSNKFTLSQQKLSLGQQLRDLQDDLEKLRDQLQNPGTIEVPLADLNEQLRNTPGLATMFEAILKKDAEIVALKEKVNPSFFETAVRPLRNEKARIEAQLDTALATARPAAEAQLRTKLINGLKTKLQESQRALERCQAHIRENQAQITGIEQQLTQLRGGNNPEKKLKLLAAQSDLAGMEKNRDELDEKLRRAKADALAISRIVVVEPAQVPKERTTDRKWKFGGAAAVGAFALAFLGVALLDFRLRRVNSVKDITQGLGLQVVGTLPLVPNRDARQLLMLDDAEANHEQLALREAVDGVRTVVLHSGRQHPLQVLLVASALNGEGKTTLASQLATSLARSGRRTLLLDCDLRSTSCAELFNRPVTPGVCEVLRGEVPIEDAIQTTEQANLFLVPGGKCDSKALQALAQDLPKNLFDILREHFDFIVVDSSPLLPVSDALQIAIHTDAVLMAIMEQSSQLPAVHQAQQKLAALHIRVLGAVVGGTQQQIYPYGSHSRVNQKALPVQTNRQQEG
jgi:capsular exopolysaccharide synthesis family protein